MWSVCLTCVSLTCDAHVIAVERVGKPVTEYAVGQGHFPNLDSCPQMNEVRSLVQGIQTDLGHQSSP